MLLRIVAYNEATYKSTLWLTQLTQAKMNHSLTSSTTDVRRSIVSFLSNWSSHMQSVRHSRRNGWWLNRIKMRSIGLYCASWNSARRGLFVRVSSRQLNGCRHCNRAKRIAIYVNSIVYGVQPSWLSNCDKLNNMHCILWKNKANDIHKIQEPFFSHSKPPTTFDRA